MDTFGQDHEHDEDDDDFDETLCFHPEDPIDDAHLVTNQQDWHSGAWPLTLQDIAVTTAGLAANLAKVVNVFFLDIRRDLCAARNNRVRQLSIQEFDESLVGLPETVASE